MRTTWMMAAIAGSALALGACGGNGSTSTTTTKKDTKTATTDTTAATDQATQPLTIQLQAQNASGVTGTATLTPQGNKTKVVVDLQGDTSTDAHPAHIHDGTCAKFDAAPKWPLTDVVKGHSETTVDAPLADMTGEPYILNVHKSAAEIQTYISCGVVGS